MQCDQGHAMISETKQPSYLVPFPKIPESMQKVYSTCNLHLRKFGFFEKDLDINFNQKLRPHIATQVLQCCTVDKSGKTLDKSFFWDLPIGKRIECLLIITNSGDSSIVPVYLQCLNQSCKQQIEVNISQDELINLQHRADTREDLTIHIGDKNLQIRKPTGRDQLEWLKDSFQDEDTAIKAIIGTLILGEGKFFVNMENPLPDEWIQTFNILMEELDPLVNFNLLVLCPYCEIENLYEIDLENLLLRKLRGDQQALFEVVHCLATHYHWSEQQILSIPPWRRSHYLDLIKGEEDR